MEGGKVDMIIVFAIHCNREQDLPQDKVPMACPYIAQRAIPYIQSYIRTIQQKLYYTKYPSLNLTRKHATSWQ